MFPNHFEDFQQIVPVPSYTRRDGVLNLVSHFPKNTVAPDIGELRHYQAYQVLKNHRKDQKCTMH